MSHFDHTPDVFSDKEDYVKHITNSFDKFHDSISKDKKKFTDVRKISFALSLVLVILVVIRIIISDSSTLIPYIGLGVSIIFIILLVFWALLRNIMIHKHKQRIRHYAHILEEMQEEYKLQNKGDNEDEKWWETADAVVHKSESILREAKERDSHFRVYFTNIGYLTVLTLFILILKFIFKVF